MSAYQFTNGEKPTDKTVWLHCNRPRPEAPMRLISFGWSGNRGGQGSAFDTKMWVGMEAFEVYTVQLPGYDKRAEEKPIYHPSKLVRELVAEIGPALKGGKPYVFIGFAFGAVVAFEAARAISEASPGEGPAFIVPVSSEGPGWEGRNTTHHELGGDEFKAMLKERGGSKHVFENAYTAEKLVAGVKAGLAVEEKYKWSPDKLIGAPILAIHGSEPGRDKEKTKVSAENAALWLQATQAAAKSKVVAVPSDWYIFEDQKGATSTFAATAEFAQELGLVAKPA
jgi:surfactin synthase thioesterase subunit